MFALLPPDFCCWRSMSTCLRSAFRSNNTHSSSLSLLHPPWRRSSSNHGVNPYAHNTSRARRSLLVSAPRCHALAWPSSDLAFVNYSDFLTYLLVCSSLFLSYFDYDNLSVPFHYLPSFYFYHSFSHSLALTKLRKWRTFPLKVGNFYRFLQPRVTVQNILF